MGIMEQKTETTIVYLGYMGIMEMNMKLLQYIMWNPKLKPSALDSKPLILSPKTLSQQSLDGLTRLLFRNLNFSYHNVGTWYRMGFPWYGNLPTSLTAP